MQKGNVMTALFSEKDEAFMREAIELAKTGEGRVSPNPPVGCVIVKDGRVVGRGWHDRLGDLHAEAAALRLAGVAAAGATVYVTLSPCTSHGRQPPCSVALIKAGVGRVIVAAPDPNPCNSCGVDALRAAGIPVEEGLLREDAEYVARGFFKMLRTGMPYLTVKYAMTLDGRIAAAGGDSRWISGEESREWVHDFRSRMDAVMVGSGTALADDPLLTVRGAAWDVRCGESGHRQPLRVVVDGGLRMPVGAAMLRESCVGEGGGVVVVGVEGRNPGAAERLRDAGADVLLLDGGEAGMVPLEGMLRDLGKRGVNMVLCEGGGGLAGALLEGGLVDEVVGFVAPKIIGGVGAPGPVGGEGRGKMAEAWMVDVMEWRRIGEDFMVRGKVRP